MLSSVAVQRVLAIDLSQHFGGNLPLVQEAPGDLDETAIVKVIASVA